MQNIFIRLGYNFQRKSQIQSWMLRSSLAVVIIITDLRSVSGGKKSVMAIHTNHIYSSHTSYRSSISVAQRQCQEGRVNRRQNHLVCAFSSILGRLFTSLAKRREGSTTVICSSFHGCDHLSHGAPACP